MSDDVNGIPYVEDGDNLADFPVHSLALAQAADRLNYLAGGRLPKVGTYLPPFGVYGGHSVTSIGTTTSNSLNSAVMTPFVVPVPMSFDRLTANCGTAATDSNATLTLGLYDSRADFIGPENLLASTSAMDVTTTGLKEGTISASVDPGLYWVVGWFDADTSTGTNPQFWINSSAGAPAQEIVMDSNNSVRIYELDPSGWSSLPDPAPFPDKAYTYLSVRVFRFCPRRSA